jgi:hypothetical protein
MVEAYWLVGRRIVEEEQNGKDRAAYGMEIIKTLSKELNAEFGKGYSVTNLKNIRKFYLYFKELEIGQTVSDQFKTQIGRTLSDYSIQQRRFAKLSWSHFERLIRVENVDARNWYLIEAAEQNWAVRTLDRNISTKMTNMSL